MRVTHLKKDVSWQDQDLGGRRLVNNAVCIQRYGGFGDMLQMSSILPGLKEQGCHITVNTTPKGLDIIRHDPHIDAVFLQDDDQVPNHELGFYWDKLSSCFDRFIMLSESVEGALLAIPDRRESAWHPDFRRMIMGTVDYLEATHAIAEVPMPPRVEFYPSETEIRQAKARRARLGFGNRVVLWALAGTSVHKVWPYLDVVVARMLVAYDDVKIVFCGDALCQVLEMAWEKEPRVTRTSGRWGIRETLAFAKTCDLVIGPETGVLNSVSMLDIPKVLMLSHSSPANLGSNWVDAHIVTPTNTPCYPCHILHRGFELCCRDEVTGVAMCAANTTIEDVWSGVTRALGEIDEQHLLSAMPKVS